MKILNTRIITIDGPSGVGKGTISHMVAEKLGWKLLDSGALYRILAYASYHALSCHPVITDAKPQKPGSSSSLDPVDSEAITGRREINEIVKIAQSLDITFRNAEILLNGINIESIIRTEEIGILASKIAAHQAVRDALYTLQRSFATDAGLVADGRDMGTMIFPEAYLKFFLTATSNERAQRRFLQLQARKIHVSIRDLLREIEARDERDQTRTASPLKPAMDAIIIDTSTLSIDQVFNAIWLKIVGKGGEAIRQNCPS